MTITCSFRFNKNNTAIPENNGATFPAPLASRQKRKAFEGIRSLLPAVVAAAVCLRQIRNRFSATADWSLSLCSPQNSFDQDNRSHRQHRQGPIPEIDWNSLLSGSQCVLFKRNATEKSWCCAGDWKLLQRRSTDCDQ